MLALLLTLLAPPVDTTALAAALPDFEPPPGFKAVVVTFAPGDVVGRWFSWHDTHDDTDWYPASSIKVFPAVAALEWAEAEGVDLKAEIAFERAAAKPYVRRLDWLVQQTLTQSSNLGYDRLVQLVGVDALHAGLLSEARGFGQTAVQLTYSASVGSLLDSPAVTVGRGDKARTWLARVSSPIERCAFMPNCTSVAALAELMRRVMLHESLPPTDQLKLSPKALTLLREALGARKPRGTEVADALSAAFGHQIKVFHKPGYYPDWRSDVVYGVVADGRRFIVALAGRGGRGAITPAAHAIGRLLARRVLGR